MKICEKCKNEKDLSDFNKNITKKDGLSNWCKICKYKSMTKAKDNNPELYTLKNKEYKLKNKEVLKEKSKEYNLKNKDKIKKYKQEYMKTHKPTKKYVYEITEERRKQKNEWAKNDRKNKPWYYSHRDLLNRIIKDIYYKKTKSTNEELGYSSLELKEHIEKLFLEGMSWENRKEWHIDHIKPISLFDEKTSASEINALVNLQPLWKLDNLRKSNSVI